MARGPNPKTEKFIYYGPNLNFGFWAKLDALTLGAFLLLG